MAQNARNDVRLDALDARLVALLAEHPRIGVLGAARLLGIARATVQARLDRLVRPGILALEPRVDPSRFGFPVSALVSLELQQSHLGTPAAEALEAIPEVIEIHSVSGQADLLVRVVARSNEDLQRVLHEILAIEQVLRTSSSILLKTFMRDRTLTLFTEVAAGDHKRPE
jgi:Lrp/AsnC family transcriptional regulator for asnA, asnC and gidA